MCGYEKHYFYGPTTDRIGKCRKSGGIDRQRLSLLFFLSEPYWSWEERDWEACFGYRPGPIRACTEFVAMPDPIYWRSLCYFVELMTRGGMANLIGFCSPRGFLERGKCRGISQTRSKDGQELGIQHQLKGTRDSEGARPSRHAGQLESGLDSICSFDPPHRGTRNLCLSCGRGREGKVGRQRDSR